MAVEEIKANTEFMKVVEEIRTAVDARTGETAAVKTVAEKAAADLERAWKKIDELEAKANRPAAAVETKDAERERQFKEFSAVLRRKGDYQIASNTGGGYTVPALMADEIIRKQRDYDPMRQVARVITISNGSPLNIPRITTAQTGGFTTETASRTASSAAVFEQRVLTPHPLYTQVKVTYALLEDSAFDVEALIMDESAKALAYYEGAEFVHGDGNGVPYGLMHDTTILANSETGGNDVLTADSLVKLPFKLATHYLTNGSNLYYMMERATMASAVALKDGTSGTIGGYYFHAEPTGPYKWTFNGYPVLLADTMASLGNAAVPVVFGDMKQYWIADVAGSMRIIVDPYSAKGYVTYHIEKRVGGQVADPDAFAVITLS